MESQQPSTSTAPPEKIELNKLLEAMVGHKASDMFVTVAAPISIKVNGRLVPQTPPLTAAQARDIVVGSMNPKQRQEFEESHECNFAIGLAGVGRFRVSAFYQRNSVGMVIRRIETKIPTVEELMLPEIVKELAMTKKGIILFVGGTGSGKSTSLAAMIGYRNGHSSGHIITIEDPIEFVHQHQGCVVTQREVGVDTDSWEVALKNTLRQAPDVILIGEIRTRESMDHAIAFAETGHLVMATLHANNANQTLDRVINFFPEERRNQLLQDMSLNLKAVIAQQLVRHPDGQSRSAMLEILINTPLISDKIRVGDLHEVKGLMKTGASAGMQTFDQALIAAYHAGKISYEDALAHADSANEVRLRIKLDKAGNDAGAALGKGLGGLELEDK